MKVDERQLTGCEAIILSMTPAERRHPDADRRQPHGAASRAGSGTNVQAVNQLLTQFRQMQKMMKQVGTG